MPPPIKRPAIIIDTGNDIFSDMRFGEIVSCDTSIRARPNFELILIAKFYHNLINSPQANSIKKAKYSLEQKTQQEFPN